jgi:hypothetical protein
MNRTNEATDLAPLLTALERVGNAALEHAKRVTDGGKGIDDHQVHCERVSYLATEIRAVKALVDYAESAGAEDARAAEIAAIFAAQVAERASSQVSTHLEEFGFKEFFLEETLGAPAPCSPPAARTRASSRVSSSD